MGGMPDVSNIAVGSVFASNQAQANAQMNEAANMIGSQLQRQLASQSDLWPDDSPRYTQSATSVAQTAASRVRKPDWEIEEDRKDRELDEMIARHKAERGED